jgi:hypothetical protein
MTFGGATIARAKKAESVVRALKKPTPQQFLPFLLTTDQFLYTPLKMDSKTVEIKPFQDQKPGT